MVLRLRPRSCQFFRPKVTYLGHVVSVEVVATDPAKTEAVTNWPKPKTLKDLTIPAFCLVLPQICSSLRTSRKTLHELVSNLYEGGKNGKQRNKSVESSWNQDCQKAYESLKQALTSPFVLAYLITQSPLS